MYDPLPHSGITIHPQRALHCSASFTFAGLGEFFSSSQSRVCTPGETFVPEKDEKPGSLSSKNNLTRQIFRLVMEYRAE